MPSPRRQAFKRHALIAASAAASSQRPMEREEPPSPATRATPPMPAGFVPRARHSAKPWAANAAPVSDGGWRPRDMGRGARSDRRRFAANHRKTWAERRRVLSFGSIAHRGLLRRQQADEGLYWLRQCRYEFAAVHVVVRRRPQTGVRLGYGARLLRGSRRGGPPGAGGIERRMVPPGPISKDDTGA